MLIFRRLLSMSAVAHLASPPRVATEVILANPHNFDRSLFSRKFVVRALRLPKEHTQTACKLLKKSLLALPRCRNVVADEAHPEHRLILLDPSVEQVPEDAMQKLQQYSPQLDSHEVELGYDNWSTDQIIRAALPADKEEVTTAFETVGHLAHMNLRDDDLPYKYFIGQVVLDKNHALRTVVNKLNEIDTTYRFFHMELLAGVEDYMCTVRECGCTYTFDFSKVYWNSRLQTEHARLVKLFKSPDVICDMMAGVGPFAIPAASKGCRVYANDLNPNSYESLFQNARSNNVAARLEASNKDARMFIRELVQRIAIDSKATPPFNHVVMNLPGSALTFLDVFRGLYHSEDRRAIPLPKIHCYCFTKADEDQRVADVRARAEEYLGGALGADAVVYDVRNVAPKKEMMCLSFTLPADIAYAEEPAQDSEPAAKRPHQEAAAGDEPGDA